MRGLAKYMLLGLLGDTGAIDYNALVLATNPIAFWPLNELSGSNAADISGNSRTGTYSNVTLDNQDSVVPGERAGLWVPASSSHVATYSAGLIGDLTPATQGSMGGWLKVASAGDWTDGQSRFVIDIFVSSSNRIRINKNSVNNQMILAYTAGGTTKSVTPDLGGTTEWFHTFLTWNKAADRCRFYVNGVQNGADQTGLGTYSGTVSSISMALGSFLTNSAASLRWDGSVAYWGLWDSELTPTQVASLVPTPFLA